MLTVASFLMLLSAVLGKQLPIEPGMDTQPLIISDMAPYVYALTCPLNITCSDIYGKVPAKTIAISNWVVTNNLPLAAHVVYHEWGHVLYGPSEAEAEAYACQEDYLNVYISGQLCGPSTP